MIIHDSKIVFIHIPKTGGTTIEHMLLANKGVGKADTHFAAHHRLDQVFKKYDRPPEDDEDAEGFVSKNISSYTMFTVARNPWERYASLYIHDMIAWKSIRKNKKREFVEIDEYMETRVQENFFKMIEVDGVIPDSFMIINFDDFRNEVKRVFEAMDLKTGRIWHDNKKTNPQKKAVNEVLKMQSFQDAVAKMCDKEIKLFAYDLPV
jgi:hypothetical protein